MRKAFYPEIGEKYNHANIQNTNPYQCIGYDIAKDINGVRQKIPIMQNTETLWTMRCHYMTADDNNNIEWGQSTGGYFASKSGELDKTYGIIRLDYIDNTDEYTDLTYAFTRNLDNKGTDISNVAPNYAVWQNDKLIGFYEDRTTGGNGKSVFDTSCTSICCDEVSHIISEAIANLPEVQEFMKSVAAHSVALNKGCVEPRKTFICVADLPIIKDGRDTTKGVYADYVSNHRTGVYPISDNITDIRENERNERW